MKPPLFSSAAECFLTTEPGDKCTRVNRLRKAVEAHGFCRDETSPAPDVFLPGRPEFPRLVDPSGVPRRRLGRQEGRAALVHAIAHIEFNAINLALDALCRFRGMPDTYYLDWLTVADDEARHFLMLQQRLSELGAEYGEFPAHNGLWEMAQCTADSCLARMALVPRVLEARGLDVTPGMIERLEHVGDVQTIAVLEVILREEVEHVAIGTRWFRHCCELEGKSPVETFMNLLKLHYGGTVRGPFNTPARLAAGFTDEEMAALTALS